MATHVDSAHRVTDTHTKRRTVMIQLNDTIAISRSPSEVFTFLADLNNIPKWQAEVVTSKVITTGPTKVGTRFTEEVKMGPMRATANCEVTEFSPDRMMAFKAVSPSIKEILEKQ